jgi:dihydroorotase
MRERGGNAKAGDVIPYIFCLPTGDEPEKDKDKQALRARHPDEIRKNRTLQIGTFSVPMEYRGGDTQEHY